MALRSLLARTTTTLWRRAPSSVPVVCAAPRMSPAASSSRRRYTSQGGYGTNWDKEFDRLHADYLKKSSEDLIKESRSKKFWSFMESVNLALGFVVYTGACVGAGFVGGFVYGVDGTLKTIARELPKMTSDVLRVGLPNQANQEREVADLFLRSLLQNSKT